MFNSNYFKYFQGDLAVKYYFQGQTIYNSYFLNIYYDNPGEHALTTFFLSHITFVRQTDSH